MVGHDDITQEEPALRNTIILDFPTIDPVSSPAPVHRATADSLADPIF
jgi:hypothetical protein